MGDHCVGVWLVHMFTTRTVLRINHHSVPLAPTTVTQTIQTVIQLIYCCLISACIYNIHANVCEWACLLRKCIMFLSWLLFCSILFATTKHLHHSSLICLLFSAACPLQMSQIVLFSVLFSVLAVFWIWEAGGSLSVWVIFLHQRAESIWRAPDMAISVFISWSPSCAKLHMGDVDNKDSSSKGKKRFTLEGFLWFRTHVVFLNHFCSKKKKFFESLNC